jgi:hypothetical protein
VVSVHCPCGRRRNEKGLAGFGGSFADSQFVEGTSGKTASLASFYSRSGNVGGRVSNLTRKLSSSKASLSVDRRDDEDSAAQHPPILIYVRQSSSDHKC